MNPELMLIDGHYFLHRCLHLSDFASLSTQDGRRTGGVYGVISSIKRSLEKFPSVRRCVLTWDTGRSPRRMKLLPTYKANRNPNTPEEKEEHEKYRALFDSQLVLLQQGLGCLGVRQVLLNNREGDDLLAEICRQWGGPKVVVTEDKDLLQLVDADTVMWRPMKETLVNLDNFQDQLGIAPEFYLLYKALLGDPSDNIPGIELVGPKTIEAVIRTAQKVGYDSNYKEMLIDACETQPKTKPGKMKAKIKRLAEGLDVLDTNLAMMDLAQEEFSEIEKEAIRVMVSDGRLQFRFREQDVIRFLGSLELQSFLKFFAQFSQCFKMLH